jgi:hypothetical protein
MTLAIASAERRITGAGAGSAEETPGIFDSVTSCSWKRARLAFR